MKRDEALAHLRQGLAAWGPKSAECAQWALDELAAAEQRIAELENALGEVSTSLDCNHIPDDGGDECDGEDCLRCMAKKVLK